MKWADRFPWIAAGTLAVLSHVAAVVAVAGLLHQGPLPPRHELKLARTDLLKPSEIVAAAGPENAAISATIDVASAASAAASPELASQSDAAALSESGGTQRPISQSRDSARVTAGTASEALAPASSPGLRETETSGSGQHGANQDIAPLPSGRSATSIVLPEASGAGQAIAPSSDAPVVAAASAGTGEAAIPDSQSGALRETLTPRTGAEISHADTAVTAATETAVAAVAPLEGIAAALRPVSEAGPPGVVAGETDSPVVAETQPAESIQDSAAKLALVVPRQSLPSGEPPPKPPARDALGVEEAVRGYAGGSCFLAIPRQDLAGSWTVTSYGTEQGELDAFDRHVKALVGTPVLLARRPLQQAQCQAVEFASIFAKTAPRGFEFNLDQSRLGDGGNLSGLISGTTKQWIYVLLIDDDGMAQDVSKFAVAQGNGIRIAFPVHVKGEGKARAQLLFAIASDRPLAMLAIPAPRPLAELLPLVRGEIAAAKAQVEVAVADFEVY
jgi:hypothetical protein